jgi:hypothetical protein
MKYVGMDMVAHAGRAAPGIPGGRLGLFLAVAMLILSASGLSAQFAVYPVLVTMDVTDQVGTQTLTVENQGDEPLELAVYLSDYDRTDSGDHQYLPFGEHPNTCKGRMEVFPDQLALQAGEKGEIRLRMQPGPGTCWAMVFVEKRTLTPSGITMAQRIGAKVVAESSAATREGRVLGMAADTTAEPAALLAFENQGTGKLDVTGEVEVRDLTGEVVGVVDVDPFGVLPGRTRRIRVPLTGVDLAPGRYIMVAVLDFGADYLAGGQAMIEVAP